MTQTRHRVRVSAVARLGPSIREIHLEPLEGDHLPAFSPGSHVVMELPLGEHVLRNAYSLTSSPFERSRYAIAVRRQPDSRGGSRWIHDELVPGRQLRIEAPNNYFPIRAPADGAPLLLIAGGIGITPFMSLLRARRPDSGPMSLHYAFRDRVDTAYLAELKRLLGSDLHTYESTAGERLDPASLLAAQHLGTQVAVCGPAAMIEAVRAKAAALGWPEQRVLYERFSAPAGGTPFRVRLQRSGRSIAVSSEETLLEALERAQVPVRSLCRAGVCGECRTDLLGGEAEHQDLFLSDQEKTAQCAVMPCVSRACAGGELLLDL